MLKIATEKVKHEVEYKGVFFEIEKMSAQEEKDLLKKHTKRVAKKPGPGAQKQFVEEIDFLALTIDRFDRQVVGWRGSIDVPCNREMKEHIVTNPDNRHISEFINEAIAEIGEAEKEEIKAEEKNSENGQSGVILQGE